MTVMLTEGSWQIPPRLRPLRLLSTRLSLERSVVTRGIPYNAMCVTLVRSSFSWLLSTKTFRPSGQATTCALFHLLAEGGGKDQQGGGAHCKMS